MAIEVKIDARLKKVSSSMKVNKDGDTIVLTGVQLEGDDILEEDVKTLVRLQSKGRLRITVTPVQGELPMKKKEATA